MIVYIESNFIIELAYLQNQHASCETILSLAESRKIKLISPAFSIEEPFGSWGRKRGVRAGLIEGLSKEATYLAQSELYRGADQKFKDLYRLLRGATGEERQRLNAIMNRILKTAAIVAIDQNILDTATLYQNDPLNLSPQDSIIYASVLFNLARAPADEPKCFLNKNRHDFSQPEIVDELTKRGCKLLTTFPGGLGYIENRI